MARHLYDLKNRQSASTPDPARLSERISIIFRAFNFLNPGCQSGINRCIHRHDAGTWHCCLAASPDPASRTLQETGFRKVNHERSDLPPLAQRAPDQPVRSGASPQRRTSALRRLPGRKLPFAAGRALDLDRRQAGAFPLIADAPRRSSARLAAPSAAAPCRPAPRGSVKHTAKGIRE